MITVSFRELDACDPPLENALPKFRSLEHEIRMDDSFLLEEEKAGYGYETGDRFLPYKWQDVWSREKKRRRIRTVVMENDHVRCEFWPEYGMRLMSLFRKEDDRELLFSNPVLQFGNLAIRRAWFSGGIEWNIGQLGHSFTTCEPLFVSLMRSADGEEFLRAFEFERQKRLWWSLDFHLAEDDKFLTVYGRIVNPDSVSKPCYWWTNIAVPEESGQRIFSGTGDVIYIDKRSLDKENAVRVMAHGHMPYLGIREGVDYSYPENFTDYATEYFFQNRKTESMTWEASAYADGNIFFTRSDRALPYYKMFCWGKETGGRHWRQYLSEPANGDYIELQCGFTRTQMHGTDIPAETVWDFIEVFGGTDTGENLTGDYDEERKRVFSLVENSFSTEELLDRKKRYAAYSSLTPSDFLQYGSSYGALEEKRNTGITPSGFFFPADSIRKQDSIWAGVLEGCGLPEEEIPPSYMTDFAWHETILHIAGENFCAWNVLGVMYLENGMRCEAEKAFTKALELKENAFSYRCLAIIAQQDGDYEEACNRMSKGVHIDSRREYAEEYADMLSRQKEYSRLWDFYESLDESVKADERLVITMLPAACALEKTDFLRKQYEKEFSVIREGERNYTESWFVYQALLEAQAEEREVTPDDIERHRRNDQIPFRLEFRMS